MSYIPDLKPGGNSSRTTVFDLFSPDVMLKKFFSFKNAIQETLFQSDPNNFKIPYIKKSKKTRRKGDIATIYCDS